MYGSWRKVAGVGLMLAATVGFARVKALYDTRDTLKLDAESRYLVERYDKTFVRSGALEQSNVDLSTEFVNMIVASTGFSAASRVITTSDQLIQELLNSSR